MNVCNHKLYWTLFKSELCKALRSINLTLYTRLLQVTQLESTVVKVVSGYITREISFTCFYGFHTQKTLVVQEKLWTVELGYNDHGYNEFTAKTNNFFFNLGPKCLA